MGARASAVKQAQPQPLSPPLPSPPSKDRRKLVTPPPSRQQVGMQLMHGKVQPRVARREREVRAVCAQTLVLFSLENAQRRGAVSSSAHWGAQARRGLLSSSPWQRPRPEVTARGHGQGLRPGLLVARGVPQRGAGWVGRGPTEAGRPSPARGRRLCGCSPGLRAATLGPGQCAPASGGAAGPALRWPQHTRGTHQRCRADLPGPLCIHLAAASFSLGR